jgi:hypothetical protein
MTYIHAVHNYYMPHAVILQTQIDLKIGAVTHIAMLSTNLYCNNVFMNLKIK